MLSRRSFLKSTLGAGLGLATQGCQQMVTQPARKRTIVDAQVHLWKAESPDWPWVPGVKPQLPEPFTIERALPMMDEAGVDRVVIVPPTLDDRNDYAIEAAKRYPNRFAVMGRIPLQDPKSAELLPKWKEQPGMLGVRVTFNTPTTLRWLSDGTVDWFWPAAEKAGLPVMFLAFGEVPRFAPIAERHPQLHPHHRPHGRKRSHRDGEKNPGRDRPGGGTRQVPERQHQDVGGPQHVARIISVPRRDPAPPSRVRRLRPAALLLGDRHDELRSPGRPTASASPISPRS